MDCSRNKKIEYCVVTSIVILSFFISYGIRTQPLNYGMEIDEFDPYFNYRATQYLVDNGFEAYTNWHDDLSWYPTGRDVFDNSQAMLHITAAVLYQPFSDVMTLKDFVIYFPAIIGSLTVVPIFLLVRRLTDNKVGALASLFYAISITFIVRGTAGWFKSEPLGLFYGVFGIYFFISGMMSIFEGKKLQGIMKLGATGVCLAFGLSSWGGVIFFFLPLLAWLIMVPGMKQKILNISQKYDISTIITSLIVFSGVLIGVSLLFVRSGAVVSNYVGISIFFVIGFLIFEHIMSSRFKWKYIKTLVVFGVSVTVFGYFATSLDVGEMIYGCPDDNRCAIIKLPFDRYAKVLFPFDDNSTELSKSVAEHQKPELSHIFSRTAFLFIFTPIGFVAVVRKHIPILTSSFVVTISVIAMYVGMTYVRLELFMSLGMILMSSLGIIFLFQKFADTHDGVAKSERQLRARKTKGYVIIIMLLVIMLVPTGINWSIMVDRPALILTGASMILDRTTTDWIDALTWLKTNTPEDSKVMAWWDYGYWIQTVGNRTTYMDNGAYLSDRIVDNANLLTDTPKMSLERLQEKDVDYVLVYIAGENRGGYVRLGFGDDVAKMYWILKIGERDTTQYIDRYNQLNEKFYRETMYGSMIPFVPRAQILDSNYVNNPTSSWGKDQINPETGQLYEYGWLKFEQKNTAGAVLVYASPEFQSVPEEGTFHGILIYQVPKKIG